MSKKKIALIIVAVVVVIAAVVAAVVLLKPEANVEGTLEEIMTKVYAGIPTDELPGSLANMPVDASDPDTVAYYLGTSEVSFKEALACEPMMSSQPHSVVLVRLNDAKDAETVVAKIKENANPRKWFCVEAKNVVVESKGDLVVLMMVDSEGQTTPEVAERLKANFGGLK